MKVPHGYGDEYEDPMEPGTVYGRPMPWRGPKPPVEWFVGWMSLEVYILFVLLPPTYILVGGPLPAVLLLFPSYREALIPMGGGGSHSERFTLFVRDSMHSLGMTAFWFLTADWILAASMSLYTARKPDVRRWVGHFGLAWCGTILLTGLLRAAAWKAAH